MSLSGYVAAIPKIELHVHLEGSIRPRTLLELARRNGVALPAADEAGLQEAYRFVDFMHFIRTYVLISSTLATADDFALIVRDFGADMARQNTRYAEVTFTPITHVERGVPLEAIFAGLDAGRAQARAEHGVEIRWVFDIVRSFPATAEACLAAALAGMDHGVIGLGLGGPEAGFPPEPFGDIFARARAAGLHSLPHAGEVAGPQSVWSALRVLGAERIGHGVRSVEDPALLDYLRERQVPLEVNPTSNVVLGVYPDMAHHPFCRLWQGGLYVTVNSDDPPLFGTDLVREYEIVARACDFGPDELERLSLNALRASCMPEEDKRRMEAQFRAEFERVRAAHL